MKLEKRKIDLSVKFVISIGRAEVHCSLTSNQFTKVQHLLVRIVSTEFGVKWTHQIRPQRCNISMWSQWSCSQMVGEMLTSEFISLKFLKHFKAFKFDLNLGIQNLWADFYVYGWKNVAKGSGKGWLVKVTERSLKVTKL